MTVDTSSNLYITDSGNNRVLEYDNPFQGFVPGSGPRLTAARYTVGLGRGHHRRSRVRHLRRFHREMSARGPTTPITLSQSAERRIRSEKRRSLHLDRRSGGSVRIQLTADQPNGEPRCSAPAAAASHSNSLQHSQRRELEAADRPRRGRAGQPVRGRRGGGTITRLLMYLDPLGSASGCTPTGDGSGCAGDIIADKVFGTCDGATDRRLYCQQLRAAPADRPEPRLWARRMERRSGRRERKSLRDGSGQQPRLRLPERRIAFGKSHRDCGFRTGRKFHRRQS